MFAVHAWYSATRGRFTAFQPACAASEKSPLAGSRHTEPPFFHARFTAIHESVSDALSTGPAACAGACHSPETDTVSFTALTSTPISRGSVFAVTSYGRLGGPPGYSRSSG